MDTPVNRLQMKWLESKAGRESALQDRAIILHARKVLGHDTMERIELDALSPPGFVSQAVADAFEEVKPYVRCTAWYEMDYAPYKGPRATL